MLGKTILALAFLTFGSLTASAEFKTGYTYHVVGKSTMYHCNAPEKMITHHLHIWFYVANDRDLYAFLGDNSGIQFNLAKARRKGGHATRVAYTTAAGLRFRYNGRMTINGDRVTVQLLGTNQRGGQRRYSWSFSAAGESCQALGYTISAGGCTGQNSQPGDSQELGDGQPESCDAYPGRPRTKLQ